MGNNIDFWAVDADQLAAHRFGDGKGFAEWATDQISAGDVEELFEFLAPQPDGWRHIGDTFESTWSFFADLQERIAPKLTDSSLVQGWGEVEPRLPSGVQHEIVSAFALPGWAVLTHAEAQQLAAGVAGALVDDSEWAGAEHGDGPTWAGVATALSQEPFGYCVITF